MFVDFIRRVREEFPRHTIFAGNVVTGEMIEETGKKDIDVVKVGLGPGSVCTTRKKIGVGYPQLSAVLECADAAHGLNGHVVSDGGCTNSGNVAKTFGAGVDFVMIGVCTTRKKIGVGYPQLSAVLECADAAHGLNGHVVSDGGCFAGHDQCDSDTAVKNGQKYKFYGMASDTAMKRHEGSVAEYCASEGKTITLPCRQVDYDRLAIYRCEEIKRAFETGYFVRVTQQTNEQYTTFEISPSELQKLNIGI
uniref:GMP reductase n=1 Tax=Wuchereria bancrofti TaxID=6293 RepID=A0AAF5Q7V5_WUCBA